MDFPMNMQEYLDNLNFWILFVEGFSIGATVVALIFWWIFG
jgi:hypothetical protein